MGILLIVALIGLAFMNRRKIFDYFKLGKNRTTTQKELRESVVDEMNRNEKSVGVQHKSENVSGLDLLLKDTGISPSRGVGMDDDKSKGKFNVLLAKKNPVMEIHGFRSNMMSPINGSERIPRILIKGINNGKQGMPKNHNRSIRKGPSRPGFSMN